MSSAIFPLHRHFSTPKSSAIRWKVLYAIGVLGLSVGCHRSFPELKSSISMADSRSATQLIAGFHDLEGGSWRWTSRKFSVVLKPPPGSEERGATLHLKLFIPAGQIKELGVLTLNADIDGDPLKSQTYSAAGSFTYTRDIPTADLRTNILPVNFCFDKAVPPGTDQRERSVIVSSIELRTK